MGNKTVAPAPQPYPSNDPYGYPPFDPFASNEQFASDPYNQYVTAGTNTSAAMDSDILDIPNKTPTPPIPHTPPRLTSPITSTTENALLTAPVPTTSPTFAFPVLPSTPTAPIVSPKPVDPVISPTTIVPIEVPATEVPTTPRTVEVPTNVTATRPPVPSPIPVMPANTRLPVMPLEFSSPVDPILASTPNPISSPVLSPDTSAVSPTLDLPPTPNGSALPTAPATPVKPILLALKNRPAGQVVHDATTSPMFSIAPPGSPVSKAAPPKQVAQKKTVPVDPPLPPTSTSKSTKFTKPAEPIRPLKWTKSMEPVKWTKPTEPKKSSKLPEPVKYTRPIESVKSTRPIESVKSTRPTESVRSTKSTEPLKSTKPIEPVKSMKPRERIKPTKPVTLSSAERYNKWNQFEREYQENQKRLISSSEYTQDSSSSPSPIPSSKISDIDLKTESIVPDIVPVPSFSLRSTAVGKPSQDSPLLTDRTDSTHRTISIFQFCLTYNETNHPISDHTKATMFKMDTRLRQTPFPIPSLAFLSKNFSDGEHEATGDHFLAPSFGSLGLQHGPETVSASSSPTSLRIQEKQRQRKLQQSTISVSDTLDSPNPFPLVTSTVVNQADFTTVESAVSQTNRSSLTSILKKPSPHFTTKPSFIVENKEIPHESQKKDIDDNPSMTSFNITRATWPHKASQSISRSEKLVHRKKLIV